MTPQLALMSQKTCPLHRTLWDRGKLTSWSNTQWYLQLTTAAKSLPYFNSKYAKKHYQEVNKNKGSKRSRRP
jgi:hypothetical protein